MSNLKRSIAVAFILALGLTMVPASVSSGGLELDGLCASGNCERKMSTFCFDNGEILYGWKNVIG